MAESTSKSLPRRVAHPPAREVVFEVRFDAEPADVVGILPGVLFSGLKFKYPRTETLPLASLPPDLRKSQPGLLHKPLMRLLGEGGTGVFIGDRVLGVYVSEYAGWANFKERVHDLIGIVAGSKLVSKIERASLKYVNLLDVPQGQRLSALNMRLEMYGQSVSEEGCRVRAELNDDDLARIIEVVPRGTVTDSGGASSTGLLITFDCIRRGGAPLSWDNLPADVERLHLEARELFFRLLTNDTLNALQPEYN